MLRTLFICVPLALFLNVMTSAPAYAVFCFGDNGFGEQLAAISTTGTARQASITARTDIAHGSNHTGSCSGNLQTKAIAVGASGCNQTSNGTHSASSNPKVTVNLTCNDLPYYTTIYGGNEHTWTYLDDDSDAAQSDNSVYFTPPDPCQSCSTQECDCSCNGGYWDGTYCYMSPIMVKIVGNNANYGLTSVQAGVMFDLGATGSEVQTAWTRGGSSVGFLVIDKNGDGQITSGAEMFGTATALSDGSIAQNGFEALQELDDNGDGVVDGSDSQFGRLMLWFDTNHNGESDPREVVSLPQVGVSGFRTQYIERGRHDRYGNWYRYEGTAETQFGQQLRIFDVFLVTAPGQR